MRGGLIDLSLRIQVESLQKRSRLLIAGRQRFECRGRVPSGARFHHRILQRRRSRGDRIEHPVDERRLQHGVAIESGDARERRRHDDRSAFRRRSRLEDERTNEDAGQLVAAHDSRARDVAARWQRLGADESLRLAPRRLRARPEVDRHREQRRRTVIVCNLEVDGDILERLLGRRVQLDVRRYAVGIDVRLDVRP